MDGERVTNGGAGNGNSAVGRGDIIRNHLSEGALRQEWNRKKYSGRDAGRFLLLRSAYLGGGIFSRANLTWLVIGNGESYHCERVDGLPHASLRDKC